MLPGLKEDNHAGCHLDTPPHTHTQFHCILLILVCSVTGLQCNVALNDAGHLLVAHKNVHTVNLIYLPSVNSKILWSPTVFRTTQL